MEKLRYGIIGVGKQGSMYSRILTTGLVKTAILTAVCDVEEERIKWATEKLAPKGVKVFSDYKEMVESGLVDADTDGV